jgi:hypothetical protein
MLEWLLGPGEITPLVKNYMREMGMNPLTYDNLTKKQKIALIEGANNWDEQVKNSKKNIPLAVQEYMKYITDMEDEEYHKLSEANKKSLLDEATKWDENKRMGANSLEPGFYSSIVAATKWVKRKIPVFNEHTNATLRKRLGTASIQDFDRYLVTKGISFNTFKKMNDELKNKTVNDAIEWISIKYVDTPMNVILKEKSKKVNPNNYMQHKLKKIDAYKGIMQINPALFHDKLRLCKKKQKINGENGNSDKFRRCIIDEMTVIRTEGGRRTRKPSKRSRRNRRATARFFVRGK